MQPAALWGISGTFAKVLADAVIPLPKVGYLCITHPFAARLQGLSASVLARLACLIHAASVRSEPRSNPP